MPMDFWPIFPLFVWLKLLHKKVIFLISEVDKGWTD